MATSPLSFLLLLLLLLLFVKGLNGTDCEVETELITCGTNSTCRDGQCRCESSFFSVSGSDTDCRSLMEPDPLCDQPECVFCGRNREGPCKRCTDFLGQDSVCVETCPGDSEINVLPEIERSVRVCQAMAARLPEWALIVIIVGAVVLVIIMLVSALVLTVCLLQRSSRGMLEIETAPGEIGTMRTKRSNSFSFSTKSNANTSAIQKVPENLIFSNSDADDEIDGDDEAVFKLKLSRLRKQADVFLRMLNEMRKRSKELPSDSPVAEQYNNVMRDVTRLLYLLNKKPSKVQMPVDGVQLLKWSQNILTRYLESQDEEALPKSRVPSYMEGSSQNTELFMEKLGKLRDHAEIFLRMLNEMRRRLKDLRPENPTAKSYRTITKDVTRLLEFLNKRPSTVEMPMDGIELVTKSEKLLERYLHSQGVALDYQQTEKLSAFGAQDETLF